MNIIQDFIPRGRRNRPGRTNPANFITIHNTGNTARTATARNHANFLKGDAAANAPVSWHYTVDDKEIFQHLPDTEDAFHAGDGAGAGNRQSIGIEVCMNEGGNLRTATDKAAELTALLCLRHNIPAENVAQHNRWCPRNKNCPQLIRAGNPYNWQTFLQKVKESITPPTLPSPPPASPTSPASPPPKDVPSDWARDACNKAVESGLLVGDGRGNFGWHEPVTLERLMVILDKLDLL